VRAATRWELTSCTLVEAVNGVLSYLVESVSLTPDGSILAVCGQTASSASKLPPYLSVLYTVPDGKELIRLPGVKSMVFDRDGKHVALVRGVEEPSVANRDEVAVRDLAVLIKSQAPTKDE
jgi:hypothetical protein